MFLNPCNHGKHNERGTIQQQAIELIKQLSTEKLKVGIDYLTDLQHKEEQEPTHELTNVS